MTSAQHQTLIAAMVESARRERAAGTPLEKARWIAVWWKLHAKESRKPGECLDFAREVLRRANLVIA